MRRPTSITGILIGHFFRRFFDNDTIQVDGDTATTVVRALAAVAAPGLMVAFFMQNQYPQRTRWGRIEDQYLFALFSFVTMAVVTIFEWEMLFPDRLDFLILTPLAIKPRQMLAAKAVALAGFIAMFVVGANALSTLIFPAACKGPTYFHQFAAHAVAVGMAGAFASLLVVGAGSVLLCVLGATRFRVLSPLLQMGAVTVLGLLMVLYAKSIGQMNVLLGETPGWARWVPPLWFLSLYDTMFYGQAAPAGAREMAPYAWRGTVAAAGVVMVTYPLAWARMRSMAMEGSTTARGASARWVARLMGWLIRRPAELGMFHFIGQTMRRQHRYQVYLAMYGGGGLALAVACAATVNITDGRVGVSMARGGGHAVMPLLLFWVIAGLRTAFGFPVSLQAGWIFRVTGVDKRECAAAARKWTLMCAVAVSAGVLAALTAAGWSWRALLVQAAWGVCLSVLLTDGFFFERSVPFNQPRMPGRNNFPLMVTLYVGVLAPFVTAVMYGEARMERNLSGLVQLAVGTLLIHLGVRSLLAGPMEVEEEMEGYEGEFQLLGLS